MRLTRPFQRLPVCFDAERLRAEVEALDSMSWVEHPNGLKGNSALRLITANGGENDEVNGVMAPTPHLARCPYIRQVLASLGVVWSRSRLMRLAPHCNVPEHADINYHWFYRVRLHIPIVSQPQVRFFCGTENVHMQPGEAWLFDNWRLHHVENGSDAERIHLVADTSGSAAFWQFAAQSGPRTSVDFRHTYQDIPAPQLLLERTALAPVMARAEVELLLLDLRSEIVAMNPIRDADSRIAAYHGLLAAFAQNWRQHYAMYGDHSGGMPVYTGLRDSLRVSSRVGGEGLVMRTNQVAVHKVLEGRVLRALLPSSPPAPAANPGRRTGGGATRQLPPLRKPLFIVAAPRSGSTLLFETLASSHSLCTLGGEAHWLVEDVKELRPGAPGIESNRLEAHHATSEAQQRIISTIADNLRDADNNALAYQPHLRLLEKTPKNSLRIPFFNAIFPDALFVFLWRDPRENLSSIMEAWRSGRWKTYNGLPGFDGPWSLLLPPGWEQMNRQPLERIAAYQWATANRIVLEDLSALAPSRWMSLSYAALLENPAREVNRIFEFADLVVDDALARRLTGPLPLSRFTHTQPDPRKWRRNQTEIESVLPQIEPVWQRLAALAQVGR